MMVYSDANLRRNRQSCDATASKKGDPKAAWRKEYGNGCSGMLTLQNIDPEE